MLLAEIEQGPRQTGPLEDDLMTVEEAAAMLKCSQATIYRRLHSCELPGMKLGRSGRWLLRRSEIMEALWSNSPSEPIADAMPRPQHSKRFQEIIAKAQDK